MHNKRKVLESSSLQLQSTEKLSITKSVPGATEAGDHYYMSAQNSLKFHHSVVI